MADQRSTDLDVFSLISLRWKLIALGCLLGLGAGYLVSRVVTPTYEATGSIVVSQPNSGTVFNSLDDGTQPEQFVNDQASIIKSSPALQEVVARLEESGYNSSFVEVDSGSEVEVEDNSNVITVTFTSDTAAEAVASVNLILEVYEEQAAEEILRYREAVSNLDLSLQDTADEIADIQANIERLVRANAGQISDPKVTLLISRRDQAVARESSLRQTRDRLAIDGRVREETTSVVSSALTARQSSFGPVPTALAGMLTFGTAAFGLAYWLTLNAAKVTVDNHQRIIQRSRLLTTIVLPKPRLRSGRRRRRPPITARIAEGPRDDVRNLAELLSWFGGAAANPFVPSLALVTPRHTDWYSMLVLEIAIATEEAGGRVLLVDAETPGNSLAKLFLAHRAGPEAPAGVADGANMVEVAVDAGRMLVASDTTSNGDGRHADDGADGDHVEVVEADNDRRQIVRVVAGGGRRTTSKTAALVRSQKRSGTATSDEGQIGPGNDAEEDDGEGAFDLDVLAQAVTTIDMVPMSVPKVEDGSPETDSLTRFLGVWDSTSDLAGDEDDNGGEDVDDDDGTADEAATVAADEVVDADGNGDDDDGGADTAGGRVDIVGQPRARAVGHRSGKAGRIDYASTTVQADETVPVSTNEIWNLVTDQPAEYDLVLVHAPPLLESTTGIRAAMAVDQVIPLIAVGSYRDDVTELMRRLDLFEVPFPGYVLVT